MKAKNPPTHGGKRPRAGRKPSKSKKVAPFTEDKDEWKELYNLADFDWDTMPEAGRRRFRELVLEAADKAIDRRRNKKPQA